MTSLKVDQKFQAPPRENFWLRHCLLVVVVLHHHPCVLHVPSIEVHA